VPPAAEPLLAANVHHLMGMNTQHARKERRVVLERRRRFFTAGRPDEERRQVGRRGETSHGTKLSLADIRRAAEHVARDIDPHVIMLGIVSGKGDYAELLFAIRGCEDEPCRVTVGVSSAASLDELRAAIRQPLEAYVRASARNASAAQRASMQ
jgi:hypothetical protein